MGQSTAGQGRVWQGNGVYVVRGPGGQGVDQQRKKKNKKKRKKKFTSFGQPTRLITCANHGNDVIRS